ncbi:hypothetical protein ACHAXR_013504 [Thalassiosira sp. AJA248-18]
MNKMLAFAAILAATMAMTTVSSSPDNQHRILTNPETGTITHPLIPHHAHLERRRRELHEKYGSTEYYYDASLPPRPHMSRHSQTPINEDIISNHNNNNNNLRSNNNNNEHHRNLQQQMGALYQGYGTHYIDIWVGSPQPQRQTVIVDTGSGVTAFPCEECKGCGDTYHTDTYFTESQSKTFRPLGCNECFRGYCASMGGSKKCRISMSYAEGSSWSAYEAEDLCYAGGPHDVALNVDSGAQTNSQDIKLDHIDPVDASQFAFNLAFGCQVSITGLFITQLADGIMGMENEKTSFWKQMHLKNAIPRPEFSLCFSRSNEAERDGTGAGAMTLGGVDPRLHNEPMVFAKNVKSSGFYAVHLKAVYLREGGGLSAQTSVEDMSRMHKLALDENALNRGNVIVDSGTTDTYFTSAAAGPFKKIWKELMGKDYNHSPVSLTKEQLDVMPTIVMVISGFEGELVGDEAVGDPNDVAGYVGDVTELSAKPKDVVIAIPAAHYMEFDPDNGKYVARFYTEESSGSVLGANAMMGHDVFFDVARGRIGFAESNCDYVSLLLSEGTSISVAPEKKNVSTMAELTPSQDQEEEEEEEEDEVVEEVGSPENEGLPPQDQEEEVEEVEDEAVEIYVPESEKPLDTPGPDQSESQKSIEPGPDQSELSIEPPPPGPDQPQNNDSPPYGNDKQGSEGGGGAFSDMANEILDDMKHECSSTSCRGIAFLFILGAAAIVIAGIRRALVRRRVVREYQEAELEISDLALDSDSDEDEGGYVDEPPMSQIT